MRVSYFHSDFPASGIADRVVSAVSALPARTLLDLTDKQMLVISERDPAPYQNLSYRNMRWQYLDDYAAASGVSLSYFIFGNQIPSNMEYSYFDEEVFALLKIIPPEKLKGAVRSLRSVYYNARMQIGHISAPNKIISLALLNKRLPELVPEEEKGKYQTDINAALLYYRKTRIKERCMLNIDYIPDLCAYFKVSPHWAFSLRGPLFFAHEEADVFFDYFCFLSRSHQATALAMLLALARGAEDELDPDMRKRIHQVIETEGGVAR